MTTFHDLIEGSTRNAIDACLDPTYAILAARPEWINCPTCGGSGTNRAPCDWCGEEDDHTCHADGEEYGPYDDGSCPDCDGTGHPTVAQLLAWGQALVNAEVHPGVLSDPYSIDLVNRTLNALRKVRP